MAASGEAKGPGPQVWDWPPLGLHLSFIRQDKIDIITVLWDEYE